MDRQGQVFARRTVWVVAIAVVALVLLTELSDFQQLVPTAARNTRGTSPRASPLTLLWPGSFQTIGDDAKYKVPFIAVGRKYVAEVSSDGFLVSSGKRAGRTVQLEFAGAQSQRAWLADPLSTSIRLFEGRAGAPASVLLSRYRSIGFTDTYPGIDARYRVTDGELELDFIVNPGAKPETIDVRAGEGTQLDQDPVTGDVVAKRDDVRYRIKRPVAYQEHGGQRTELPVEMIVDGADVRFRVAEYDHHLPLTIDPLVAVYSTFVGTNTDAGYDNVSSLATDAQGNVYVGGVTEFDMRSPAEVHGFPTTPTSLAPQDPITDPAEGPCAEQCGYVLKLDSNQQVVYGALVHGELVKAIAVDSAGNAYATGTNDEEVMNLPTTSGTFSDGGDGASFVFKLTPDGSSFVYNAIVNADSANAIAVDPQGNAYLAGSVRLGHLPTTPGSLKPNYQDPGNNTTNEDGFLLKISPTAATLVYGTYLGGLGDDIANAVTVDATGIATVAGQTSSPDFVGMPQTLDGASDAFLVQLSADGSSVLHGRFLGGSNSENATAISSDNQGGLLVGGATTSADFPVTPGVLQSTLLGQRNGWLVRLDAAFDIVYATYVGGSSVDGIQAVAADSSGNAYVAGVSFSSDLPVTPDGFQDTSSAATTDFLANAGSEFYLFTGAESDREGYFGVISAAGDQVLYGSFLSGGRDASGDPTAALLTIANAIAVSTDGAIYVAGATNAMDFPVSDGGLRTGIGGEGDGFLTKFENISLNSVSPSLLPEAEIASPYSYQMQATGGTPPYKWESVGFQLPDGLSLDTNGLISGSPKQAQTWSAGGYQFTVKVTDAAGNVAYKSHFIELDFEGELLCTPNHCSVQAAVVAPSTDPTFIYKVPNLARGVAPFTSTVSGNPPPGLTMNPDGTFSAVTSTAGDFQFAMTIADAVGHTGVINWDVNVVAQGNGTTGTGSGGTSSGGTSGSGSVPPSAGASKGGGGSMDSATLTLMLILVATIGGRRWRQVALTRDGTVE